MSGDIASLYGGKAVEADRDDASTGFEPLPAGWYPVEINRAEVKDNSAGNGKYLSIQMTVVGDRFSGRKLFPNLTLVHPNPKACEIGMRALAGLGHACDLVKVGDTGQLLGKLVDVRLKIAAAKGGYDASNAVTAYAKVGTKSENVPLAQAPSAAPSRAWDAGRAQPSAAAADPAPAKRPWER